MDDPDAGGPWGRPAPSAPRRPIRPAVLALGLFALFVIALLAIYATDPGWSESQNMAFVRIALIALPLVVWLARSGLGPATAARYVAIWAALGLICVALYSYQNEFSAVGRRTLAALRPGQSEIGVEGSVSFFAAQDHHFWIDAVVDDKNIRFLLDTGASAIVLTKRDAARLGFQADQLNFSKRFETANGVTRGAPITLSELRIGPIVFREVPAWVNQGELTQSLLGMGFLSRLSEVVITPDRLTIRR
jgi:aspartyl protease family protein